jgi:hypothetical protein
MEKLYESIQERKNSLKTPVENTFYKRKQQLHEEYIAQLDKTMHEYALYKAGQISDYTKQLSLLNGITKKIEELQKELFDKVTILKRNIELGDTDIEKLKKIDSNLKEYTSFDDLDATSKRLLRDSVSDYTNLRILFYIKLCIVFYIIVSIVKEKKIKEGMMIVVASLVLVLIWTIYQRFTSKG